MKNLGTFLLYVVLPITLLGFIFWYGWGNVFKEKHNLVVWEIYGGELGLLSQLSPVLDKNFTVINKGGGPVTIGKIYTDCFCLSANVPVGDDNFGPFGIPTEENITPLGINLEPNGEMKVKVTFNPALVSAGNYLGNVFVETVKAGEILKIPIKANIISQ